ncbi:MAG TPA: arylformamidase [Planococcus sp. (in: firmicutes)]|nr:arylformamidase [Planococcus sp. (in: firmicutes)]
MAKKIFDISMALDAQTPEWPGDVPFNFRLSVTQEQSGSVNIGELSTSTHMGTHIDAPFHYDGDGLKVEELPLEIYLTKAQVVEVGGIQKVSVENLPDIEKGVEAVLLYTAAWQDRTIFPSSWPEFDASIAEWMVDKGIRLLGVDVPSVDPQTSKELPMHQAMNRNGRFILEGIVLDGVPAGVYQLAALPLKITGADGSPVRAVLYK